MSFERTILIVDDEPSVRRALKRSLQEFYPVATAQTAREALEILDRRDVGMVISDFRMPGLTGNEFLQIVAGSYPDTLRVLLTGYANTTNLVDAVNVAQVDHVFTKPWDDDVLLKFIDEAFDDRERAVTEREQFIQVTQPTLGHRVLERQFPGITVVARDETGAVLIEGE